MKMPNSLIVAFLLVVAPSVSGSSLRNAPVKPIATAKVPAAPATVVPAKATKAATAKAPAAPATAVPAKATKAATAKVQAAPATAVSAKATKAATATVQAAPATAVPAKAAKTVTTKVQAAPTKTATAHVQAAPATSVPTKSAGESAQIAQLRAKLTKVSTGLTKVLIGAMSKTRVGAMMAKVDIQLQHVLLETKNPTDMKKALKQLQDASAVVRQMSTDMANEQAQLMHEGDEQEESLLLGVLMQRQNKPMSEQLEIVNSPDFAKLPVVVAVLAGKDMKTPLFKQVAAYLDAHSSKKPKPQEAKLEIPDKLQRNQDGKPDVTPIVLALKTRLQKMEASEKLMEEHHKEADLELDKLAEKKEEKPRAVYKIRAVKKGEDRDFAKQSAIAKQDIQTLTVAIEAVKKGDVAALTKAQAALDTSRKAAQARSGKFLVFVQLVHRAEGLDCPYCAAQCVDKCHNEGKPYVTCLTDCADAGKGK